MREKILRFAQDYRLESKKRFANNEFGSFARKDIPKAIMEAGHLDKDKYLVVCSVGQGNWAKNPWICIFDRRVTETAQRGIYIVYLLSEDCKRLYLTFNQGCTDLKNTFGKKEAEKKMRIKAHELISSLNNRGFNDDENVDLGPTLTQLGELYQKGTIFYKEYKVDAFPSQKELVNDLENMLSIYDEYVMLNPVKNVDKKEEHSMEIVKQLDAIKKYIGKAGFYYERGTVENLYLSIKSKPFVLLAGTSGTGKTRLVRLFAEAIGAVYKMVPVRPDWSDSSDLFGYVDLNGHFVEGAIIDYVKEAYDNPSKPYILCLDEMNLARVEYYLSDLLSVIETRDHKDGAIVSDPLVSLNLYKSDEGAKAKYGELIFPENLYLIGTVNMDETTFPFSRKVLDRANTIEFNSVNLMPQRTENSDDAGVALSVENDFLKTKYLLLNDCKDTLFVTDLCKELVSFNEILKKADAQIGYRIRDEIVFYMLNNKESGELLTKEEAFDNCLMQKVLPRIQGNSFSLKEMLILLFKGFTDDTVAITGSSGMYELLAGENKIFYPKSAEKVAFMLKRLEEDGFTSYWL